MPKQVNIYEAKSQLSRLVDEVEAGGEVVIARNGRPAARLVPLRASPFERRPGGWAGRVWAAPGVNEPSVVEPGVVEPGVVEPGVTEPSSNKPGATAGETG